MKMRIVVALYVILWMACAHADVVVRPPGPPRTIGREYFGMHLVNAFTRASDYTLPGKAVGSWRFNNVESSWFYLEKVPGQWTFGPMDKVVGLSGYLKASLFVSLGPMTTWASANPSRHGSWVDGELAAPKHIGDWENYVRVLASRYKGRVSAYSIWNEPAFLETDGAKGYFPAAKMVEMAQVAYRTIKREDPEAKVFTPCVTAYRQGFKRLDAYLAAGGALWTDGVCFNMYVAPPEELAHLVAGVRAIMRKYDLQDKPLWNSEFGYLIADPERANTYPLSSGPFARVLDEDAAASYVARALIIGAAAGLERFYWFGWDISNMALVRHGDHHLKPAGDAYLQVARWLTGATVDECRSGDDVLWACSVTRGGRRAHIVWCTSGTAAFVPPGDWAAATVEPLLGTAALITGGSPVTVGPQPVLLSPVE